jgi:multiple sugar transport system permease protein
MIVAGKGAASKVAHALRWVVFIVVGVALNFPIIMTLMTSLKAMADINTSPPPLIFSPTLENYREVLTGGNTDLPRYILNSIIIAGGGALIALR